MKKAIALILAMALCMAMFAGCTPKESAPSGTDNPTQTPDDSKQPPASDPNEDDYLLLPLPEPTGDKFAGMWGDYGGGVRCALFDRLLQCTPEGDPTIDCLAESHEVSDDGLTYTFKLREGVKWHDGQPFTPEDVAWSIKMALKSTQITSYFLNTFKAIEGAQDYLDGKADEISGIQIDGNTLTIKMAQPSSLMFLTMATWMPSPKHLLEEEPPETRRTSGRCRWARACTSASSLSRASTPFWSGSRTTTARSLSSSTSRPATTRRATMSPNARPMSWTTAGRETCPS